MASWMESAGILVWWKRLGGICIGEAHALLCQCIDVGSVEFVISLAGEVFPTHVIGHDQDDVWWLARQQQSGGEREESTAGQKNALHAENKEAAPHQVKAVPGAEYGGAGAACLQAAG